MKAACSAYSISSYKKLTDKKGAKHFNFQIKFTPPPPNTKFPSLCLNFIFSEKYTKLTINK